MEPDIRYYRRRACEEMNAARRAVTQAARERRLQLLGHYVERLEALEALSQFERHQFSRALKPAAARADRSAFDWPAATDQRA